MNRTNTICIFSPLYIPHPGGVERHTYNLAKSLKDRGNKVIIVTSNLYNLPDGEEEGIEIIYINSINLLGGRLPISIYGKGVRKSLSILDKKDIDLCIINTRFYPLSLIGAMYARRNDIKSICIEHGSNYLTMGNPIIDTLIKGYEHIVTSLIKMNVEDFYAVSSKSLKWLDNYGIRGRGVLPNAVSVEDIEDIVLRNEDDIIYTANDGSNEGSTIEVISIEYNENNPLRIVYAGRLVAEKGIVELIEAVNSLRDDGYSIELYIAGDGPLYNRVKELADIGIHVLGSLSHDKTIKLIYNATVFALPTEYPEGMPTAVLEAIACRTYVITTIYGGSDELITDSSYGCILQGSMIEPLKGAIKDVYNNIVDIDAVRNKAYSRLLEKYTWKRVTESIEEIIQGTKVMDEDTLFSVLVPVYGVKSYIDECIQSILNQTYSKLELILVDDGSLDGSGAICDKYASIDERIVVVHQPNGGLLSARRRAIKEASGDYIIFVDGDDYVDRRLLSDIRGLIEHNNVDIVMYRHQFVNEKGKKLYKQRRLHEDGEVINNASRFLLNKLATSFEYNSLCLKAVKRSIIDIDEDYGRYGRLQIGEDALQSINICKRCSSFAYLDRAYYNYRINQDSMTNKLDEEYIKDYIMVREALARAIIEYNRKHELKISVKEYRDYNVRGFLACILDIAGNGVGEYRIDNCIKMMRASSLYKDINKHSRILGLKAKIYYMLLNSRNYKAYRIGAYVKYIIKLIYDEVLV